MAIIERICTVCSIAFYGSSGSLYCSNKCKQAKYRNGKLNNGFIYSLINKGIVVYVGQSKDKTKMKNRIHSHSIGSEAKNFDDSEWYEVKGRSLNEAEAKEILKQNPFYNKIIPSNDRYFTVKSFITTLDEFMKDIITECCETSVLGDPDGAHHLYIDTYYADELKKKIKSQLSRIGLAKV